MRSLAQVTPQGVTRALMDKAGLAIHGPIPHRAPSTSASSAEHKAAMADALLDYLFISLGVGLLFGAWFGLWCWRDDLNRKPRLEAKDYGVLVGASLIVGGAFALFWPVFTLIIVLVLSGRVLRVGL